MPVARHTPANLFDRTWRPGDPHRPRIGRFRQLVMLGLLATLLAVIFGYLFLTEAGRVRAMAERYLGDLVGGTVEVQEARLSIFEGLRLDGIRVRTDDPASDDFFTATTLLVSYEPTVLLRGRIEATRIVAIDPVVRIIENRDRGTWNFQSLGRDGDATTRATTAPASRPAPPRQPPPLPQVLLRNARLDYSEIIDGRRLDRGAINIEGQLEPVGSERRYEFRFATRGRSATLGPMVQGSLSVSADVLDAELPRFEFGRDLQAMLPAQVRDWWQRHALSGAIRVPRLRLEGRGDAPGAFDVQVVVDGVSLRIEPEEWIHPVELRAFRTTERVTRSLRSLGLESSGLLAAAAEVSRIEPLHLQDVAGTMTFTDELIRIDEVVARHFGNTVRLTGEIGGYSPDAPVTLNLASPPAQHARVPAGIEFLRALPPPVREIYHRFRPAGQCAIDLHVTRPRGSNLSAVTGKIEIIDGQFTFERFPYPLREARGRLLFSVDEQTGFNTLVLDSIRGFGIAGTINEGAIVELDGRISPLGHTSGADITITGRNIYADPILMNALPPQTRKTLRLFDADQTGQLPRFGGSFVCRVTRTVGIVGQWTTDVDVKVHSGEGKVAGFPYPIKDLTGELQVRDDEIRIVNAQMRRDTALLQVDGVVRFPPSPAPVPPDLRPLPPPATQPATTAHLNVRGQRLPLDQSIIDALPEQVRQRLDQLGVVGFLDVEGTVSDAGPDGAIDYALDVQLRDGAIWPGNGTFAATDLSADLQLSPGKVVLERLSARRGDADVSARGTISTPDDAPTHVSLELEARRLALDASLYEMLPASTRSAWDEINPTGTIDLVGVYRSGGPDTPASYRVEVTPIELSVKPAKLPYPLERLRGKVIASQASIELVDLVASHGKTTLRGSGAISRDPAIPTDLSLSATALRIDDDLLAALPEKLGASLRQSRVQGTFDLAIDRLRVTPADGGSRVEFAGSLAATDASADVGAAISGLEGSARLEGVLQAGHLRALQGSIDVARLDLAGRSIRDLRTRVARSEGDDRLVAADLRATLAGGELAGRAECLLPQGQPTRYAVSLVLRDADAREVTGDADEKMNARLTASFAIEGTLGDRASRRGRGDVVIAGRQLYRIPVLLGLLQITNLSLPIATPYDRGTASYSLVGDTVTVEQVDLQADGMRMTGSGVLDFDRKTVAMTFSTDSAGWARIPVIGDVLQGARNELLQIRIRGTLQEPKVGAGVLPTFTTTIDEVLKGE
jgi:hypothetical protein